MPGLGFKLYGFGSGFWGFARVSFGGARQAAAACFAVPTEVFGVDDINDPGFPNERFLGCIFDANMGQKSALRGRTREPYP